MTEQQRIDVVNLGFSQLTWTKPELVEDADYPLNRSRGSLTAAQQSTASNLGYQHHDFEPLVVDSQIRRYESPWLNLAYISLGVRLT